MGRLRYNNVSGTLAASVSSSTSASVLSFAAVPTEFPTVAAPDYITIELDGGTSYEIDHITAYTSGAASATVVRAAEDSTNWPAVSHTVGAPWAVVPTVNDYGPLNAATRSASATMETGEQCWFTGSAASVTLTLPTAPWAGTNNSVTNTSSVNVTIAAGGSDTIVHYATSGLTSILIPPGMGISFTYTGTSWYVMPGTGFVTGTLVGWATYGPATQAVYNVTATTMGALDTTHLTFSPVVPPNGKILLVVDMDYAVVSTVATWESCLGWVLHNTSTVVGTPNAVQFVNTGTEVIGQHITTRTVATGQTPGVLALDVAAGNSTTGKTATYFAQSLAALTTDPVSPALMTAYALP